MVRVAPFFFDSQCSVPYQRPCSSNVVIWRKTDRHTHTYRTDCCIWSVVTYFLDLSQCIMSVILNKYRGNYRYIYLLTFLQLKSRIAWYNEEKVLKQQTIHNKSTTQNNVWKRGVKAVKPTSSYGLKPGNDLKQWNNNIFGAWYRTREPCGCSEPRQDRYYV